MKKVITTIATLAIMMGAPGGFAKTKTMSSSEYKLRFHKMDEALVGTWEKIITMPGKTEYCQFNENGTYISFERKDGKYAITGKGKWMIENGKICIIHGEERSVPVKYESSSSTIIFDGGAAYIKPLPLYVTK